MPTLRPRSIVIAMLASFAATFAPTLLALEEPAFTVIDTIPHADGDIEVRRYEPITVARTRVDGSFVNSGNIAFPRLGGYIFGANGRNEEIKMTAPVAQRADGDDGYWVSFVMPSKYSLDTLPEPRDSAVVLTEIPARVMAVAPYRGSWSTARYRRHAERLNEAVRDSIRWQATGSPEWARYNPPLWPSFLKRNEVMVLVRDADALARNTSAANP